VLVDGKATRACSTPLHAVAGKEVVTIEGLTSGERLHPLQQAFIDHGAFQCGYCTPGMLLSAHALLRETPKPSRAAIVAYLERNLCRCGAHQRIGWVRVNASPAAVGLGLFAPRQSGAGMLAQTCADWAGHPEDTAASKQRLRSCCVVADKTASAHTGARHETQG